jgi:hypothetical protein
MMARDWLCIWGICVRSSNMFGSDIYFQYSSVMKWVRVFLASPFRVYIYSTPYIFNYYPFFKAHPSS